VRSIYNARTFPCWLYTDTIVAEIFGSGNELDDVAAHWFQRYQDDDAKALTELINCVLLAAGCEQQLTEDDIRDPENSANRLTELEEAYEQVQNTSFPKHWKHLCSPYFID
jgi:cohesin complex subunit SA-1/2